MKWYRLAVFGAIVAVSVGLSYTLTEPDVVREAPRVVRIVTNPLVQAAGSWELRLLDLRQQRAERGEQEDEVVLVLLDEPGAEEWAYLSPYPRAFLADLVSTLSATGARTIGLDVYLGRLFPELNRMDGGDDRLHEAIREAGNVVLVGPTAQTDSGPRLSRPHPYFAGPAAAVGASELPTPFETVRDGTVAVRSGDRLEPSFALALYAHYRGLSADSILRAGREDGVIELPGMPPRYGRLAGDFLDEGSASFAHSFPLRYLGPPSRPGKEGTTFPAYAASLVPVAAPFSPGWFRDKVILIGTGFHDSDKFRTPFYDYDLPDATDAGWTYGVEIHANALANFLDADYLRPLGTGDELLLLLVISLVVAGVVFWQGAIWGTVAGVATAVAVAGLAFEAFQGNIRFLWVPEQANLWVPIISPLFAVLVAHVGSTVWVSVIEGRKKRFIRGAVGKCVPPTVVAEIAENPDLLRPGGQERELSILFSDLDGFTTISEEREPEELVSLLNEYLTEMTALVMDDQGTLDRSVGDAIMAFWNAPMDQPDHADRAIRCAIRMQRRLSELNDRWRRREDVDEELRVRIGVNTGDVVVGDVGGEDRFDYSAVGDAVNLAARLEPANRTYGTLTVVSEYTLRRADREAYRLRELDLIAVKGKTKPVKVYEVLGLAEEPLDDDRAELLRLFAGGLEAFRRRDWEMAEQYFNGALEIDGDDGPSRLYVRRCQEYASNPPPADWDFVVRRTTRDGPPPPR